MVPGQENSGGEEPAGACVFSGTVSRPVLTLYICNWMLTPDAERPDLTAGFVTKR